MPFTIIGATLLLLSFISCKKENIEQTDLDSVPAIPGYQLVWHDEFNGSTIDSTKWGFDTGNLGVNGEEEYYQPQNASVSKGNLVITARKESVGGLSYTSARLTTVGKFSQTYGRMEARIKMPMGMGMWPAFWMYRTNAASVLQYGELDIMEHINNSNHVYGTMFWNNNGLVQSADSTQTTPGEYHVYAIEWDAGQIRWYVDNTLYQTGNIKDDINNTGSLHLPFFMILNMAVGGDWPGHKIDESILPQSMYVDYVRVYKQTGQE